MPSSRGGLDRWSRWTTLLAPIRCRRLPKVCFRSSKTLHDSGDARASADSVPSRARRLRRARHSWRHHKTRDRLDAACARTPARPAIRSCGTKKPWFSSPTFATTLVQMDRAAASSSTRKGPFFCRFRHLICEAQLLLLKTHPYYRKAKIQWRNARSFVPHDRRM